MRKRLLTTALAVGGRGMRTGRASRVRRLGLRAVLALAALMGAAMLAASPASAVEEQGEGPQIWSDRADYSPGDTVVLSGSGWAPSEVVHITVNDDGGQTWRRDVDVIAGLEGALTDAFQLPEHFVATYTVTATGPLSGTATTSFTDGNAKAKAAPSGIVFQLTETLYSAATDCTGSVKSGFPKTVNADSNNGDTVGVGNNESVRLDAAANANSPNSSSTFVSWSSGSPFTVIGGTDGRSICVAGFQSGSRDYVATYTAPGNAAPVIGSDNASVEEDEGQTAANTGTWSDANAGDNVTLSASVGTVTKSGTNSNGTWSWSFATTDGPDENQTVTISANDGQDHVTNTTFSLTVANVAPTVTFSLANDLSVDEGSAQHTYAYTISDPGNDTVSSVTTTCGASGVKVPASDTNTNTAGSFACTFSDGPAFSTISASATDSDGSAGAAATQTVSVHNVAPTASASNDGPISEGGSATITASQTDPGTDTFTYAFDCEGDGTFGAFQASDQTSCSFGADGSYPVGVKVKDDDGGVDEASTTVVVNNVAPSVGTVQVDPNEVDEGDSVDLSAPASDPGTDDATLDYSIDWGDGSTASTGTVAAGGTISRSHTYLDDDADDAYTITVTLTDSDGDTGQGGAPVSVHNVAPTATLDPGNDLSVNEGSAEHTYSYSISDPGQDTVDSVDTSCGSGGDKVAGSDTNTDSSGSFKCTFPDGPASSEVSVSATDSDGDQGAADTQTVSVANVPPTVTGADDQAADEGSLVAFDLGSFSDPGADSPWAVDVDWGDGSPHTTFDATSTGSLGTKPHTYADNGQYTVTVMVTDDDSADSAAFTVTVANVAPSTTPPADQSATEGASKEVDLGSFSDPGADSPWAVDVDWGDGSAHTTFNATSTGSLGTKPHTYADNGQYTVTVTVTDKDGVSDSHTFKVTVANVAPTITSVAFASSSVGCGSNNATLNVTFEDPGADTWSATINWGDGSPPETIPSVGKSFSASHTYGSSGAYAVTVTVTDDDGDSDTEAGAAQVTVQYVFEGGGILQPINPGPPTSIFRYGSTIPVKVKVRDCNGTYPGTLVLKVTFQKLSGSTPTGGVSEPFSTSAADVGNQMRFTGSPDNQHIFNLASESMPDGTATYRITVSLHIGGVPVQSVSADIGLRTK
jgi:PKD domain